MNTLHLFGDSFTNFHYDTVSEEVRDSITQWGDIVGKELNLKVQNYGVWGYSNPQIIQTILTNLWKVKPNDTVIIGLSSPFRVITVRENKIDSFLPQDYYCTGKDQDKWVYDYLVNIIEPNHEIIREFYWTQIRGIQTLLNQIEVKTYLWDYKLWDKFQTITQLKGKDKDPHWSKKGHEDMSKNVIQKLTNTNPYVI